MPPIRSWSLFFSPQGALKRKEIMQMTMFVEMERWAVSAEQIILKRLYEWKLLQLTWSLQCRLTWSECSRNISFSAMRNWRLYPYWQSKWRLINAVQYCPDSFMPSMEGVHLFIEGSTPNGGSDTLYSVDLKELCIFVWHSLFFSSSSILPIHDWLNAWTTSEYHLLIGVV